jgi:hypothetical protein
MAFTGFGSGWNELEVRCDHMRGTAAGQNFILQVGTGSGPTYGATAYQNAGSYSSSASATITGYGATNDVGAGLPLVWSITSAADLSFRARIEQPAAASNKNIRFEFAGEHNTNDAFQRGDGMSVWNGSTAPLTGIQMLFSPSGVIAAGTCSLYGLAS